MFKNLKKTDAEVYRAIRNEIKRQDENLELIASENFTSLAVLEAQGTVLTNKYAEGYPYNRWYGGCDYVDDIETLAIERAKRLFRSEHANVQAYSGTQANMAVYFSVLNFGDKILSMDLSCGGHLTHGHPHNFSGAFYKVFSYGVNRKTERLDYDEIEKLAKRYRPKLILAGASAYPRIIDFKRFRKIADSVGAYLFVDMAHIAGLVACRLHPSPLPYAEFVTTTTHKTLRGPRGGMILCKKEFAKRIDSMIFPGIQGGPLMHVIAAKAVAFKEAKRDEFKDYQTQVVKNAKALSSALRKKGYHILCGGTDTHLLLIDLTNKGLTGSKAQQLLDNAGITVNKNLIPYDPLGANITSGIRLGTPALTTRGMKEAEMQKVAALIDEALVLRTRPHLKAVKKKVIKFTRGFPLYPQLRR